MKHILINIIAVLLVVTMLGCANMDLNTEETTLTTQETVDYTQPTEETIPYTEPTVPETVEEPLPVYPLNVGMAYYNFAQELPDLIYTTLGSENGLAGTIYTIEGTVTEVLPLDASGVDVDYAKVETTEEWC